jgi:hypothetical protein
MFWVRELIMINMAEDRAMQMCIEMINKNKSLATI